MWASHSFIILCARHEFGSVHDGWGVALEKGIDGNAIEAATTTNMDTIAKDHSYRTLLASGTSVGLNEGLMGNSEVGYVLINLQLGLLDIAFGFASSLALIFFNIDPFFLGRGGESIRIACQPCLTTRICVFILFLMTSFIPGIWTLEQAVWSGRTSCELTSLSRRSSFTRFRPFLRVVNAPKRGMGDSIFWDWFVFFITFSS